MKGSPSSFSRQPDRRKTGTRRGTLVSFEGSAAAPLELPSRTSAASVCKYPLIVAAAVLVVAGCNTSPPDAPQTGDHVINDAPPQQKPPAAPQDDGGQPAGPYRDGGGDARAAIAICDQCKCAASKGVYCFGGATGETYRGACTPDAGVTEDGGPVEDAAPPTRGIGCVAIPAACAKKPDCACILNALESLPCYPICRDTAQGFEVYCPNP